MKINADFDKRVIVHADEIDWQASPMPGVSRRPLDRIGAEVARATTIVRYDANSAFSPHTHDGGEEFIVLEGVFTDEHGDYPAGSYVRNPPTSSHTPSSAPGCTIFVKLWQFDPQDRTFVRIAMDRVGSVPDATRPGITVSPLYHSGNELVRLEHWSSHTTSEIDCEGGAEIFVLQGDATEGAGILRKHSWLRVPVGDRANLRAGSEGAVIWIKNGHLRHISLPPGIEG